MDNDHVAEPLRGIVQSMIDPLVVNLFANAIAAQNVAVKLGREQFALEIIRVFDREQDDSKALKGIFELCKKETP